MSYKIIATNIYRGNLIIFFLISKYFYKKIEKNKTIEIGGKKSKKIWWFQKKAVILHCQNGRDRS